MTISRKLFNPTPAQYKNGMKKETNINGQAHVQNAKTLRSAGRYVPHGYKVIRGRNGIPAYIDEVKLEYRRAVYDIRNLISNAELSVPNF